MNIEASRITISQFNRAPPSPERLQAVSPTVALKTIRYAIFSDGVQVDERTRDFGAVPKNSFSFQVPGNWRAIQNVSISMIGYSLNGESVVEYHGALIPPLILRSPNN